MDLCGDRMSLLCLDALLMTFLLLLHCYKHKYCLNDVFPYGLNCTSGDVHHCTVAMLLPPM